MARAKEPAFQITLSELQKHNNRGDCWVAVHSKVWDVTAFLDEHPGGPSVILQCAGTNATSAFDKVHAPGILEENLPSDKFRGYLAEPSSDVPPQGAEKEAREVREEKSNTPAAATTTTAATPAGPPPLHTMISAADFQKVAGRQLAAKAWAFYSSAATDLITHHQNKALLRRIMIQPRILRDVTNINMKRNILGYENSAPFFISPAAMARLAHPDGETALARAAASEGLIQCISNNASYPLNSIVKAGKPNQTFFLQLYVNSERSKTEDLLRKARDLGVKAIFVTVDAPVPGKREADERIPTTGVLQSGISGATSANDRKGGGMGRLMVQYIDKSLTWSDLAWIKRVSGLPIVLKGVQNVDDARMAMEYDVAGILLSNHGGRSLDTSQPAILNLIELRLKCPEIFSKMEVYVDGGFERGTDIIKAIALGATAVGVGRPYLYSLVYGQEGAEHLTDILKDEVENTMRLCGLTSLDQATPDLLNTADVDYLVRNDQKFPLIHSKPLRSKL